MSAAPKCTHSRCCLHSMERALARAPVTLPSPSLQSFPRSDASSRFSNRLSAITVPSRNVTATRDVNTRIHRVRMHVNRRVYTCWRVVRQPGSAVATPAPPHWPSYVRGPRVTRVKTCVRGQAVHVYAKLECKEPRAIASRAGVAFHAITVTQDHGARSETHFTPGEKGSVDLIIVGSRSRDKLTSSGGRGSFVF